MKKLLALITVVFLGLSTVCAKADHTQFVNGTCKDAHTAEGPIGSDLTKRQSKFYCDSAVITFFDDFKGHIMVQFAQKQANYSPILGFAGRVEDDGMIMPLQKVYLTAGEPTVVSEGVCKFFFKGKDLTGIACGAKVDETGRRTTAIVGFNVAHR